MSKFASRLASSLIYYSYRIALSLRCISRGLNETISSIGQKIIDNNTYHNSFSIVTIRSFIEWNYSNHCLPSSRTNSFLLTRLHYAWFCGPLIYDTVLQPAREAVQRHRGLIGLRSHPLVMRFADGTSQETH